MARGLHLPPVPLTRACSRGGLLQRPQILTRVAGRPWRGVRRAQQSESDDRQTEEVPESGCLPQSARRAFRLELCVDMRCPPVSGSLRPAASFLMSSCRSCWSSGNSSWGATLRTKIGFRWGAVAVVLPSETRPLLCECWLCGILLWISGSAIRLRGFPPT